MAQILVSGHNPMTGPRHLGHYVSTIREWQHLQYEYESFIIIDDLLARFLNPVHREEVTNSTLFVIRDFLAGGLDPAVTRIVVTSMLPEFAHLIFLLGTS